MIKLIIFKNGGKMRIEILVQNNNILLPIDQNYILGAAVYNLLSCNKEFAEFLHNKGYVHKDSNRIFKFYTYSQLTGASRKIIENKISFNDNKLVWQVSSPVDDFIDFFAEGLLSQGYLKILDKELPILDVITKKEPVFSNEMRFTCLSPIVADLTNESGTNYLPFDDENINNVLESNLIRKYETLFEEKYNSKIPFQITFDKNYIDKRNRKIYKLVKIKNIKVKGILCPFELICDPKLMEVAYSCGLGTKNSMGFGMIEEVKNKKIKGGGDNA